MKSYNAGESIQPSKRVSLIAIMTALALVGNYALVAVPNVELGSTILFFTGYIFGFQIALPCVLLMALIFGSINPWGAFIPQIWFSQVIGWTYIVFAAHLLRPKTVGEDSVSTLTLMVTGAFVTLIFDLITNIGFSVTFNIPFLLAMIGGTPFMVVHVISNGLLFGLVIPRLEHGVILQFIDQIWNRQGVLELKTEE
ncbi:MAG: hypothetical protein K9W43_02365 [Candidatus Thorarchaeota archaeon]|nr:hypothetical protein [Candidatus Thorarchaeota archaeon]